MDNLVAAWREFSALERQHPDEARDFTDAIHACQRLIGQRVVRRAFPKGWPTHHAAP